MKIPFFSRSKSDHSSDPPNTISSAQVENKQSAPANFTPTPSQVVLLTGNHVKDFQALHSLYSTSSELANQYDRQLDSVVPDSPEEQRIFNLYASYVAIQTESGLLLNAIAPKEYGQPDPNRILTPDELLRAQSLVDSLCRGFVSYYELSKSSNAIKDNPSERVAFQELERKMNSLMDKLTALSDELTEIYWPSLPIFPVKSIPSSESLDELGELQEKIKKLESENKLLSNLSNNQSSENSRLKKQIADYRHDIEEKDATITVLKKRLNAPADNSNLSTPNKQIEELNQKLLKRDAQLEELQKRYARLDSDYADDLDKVSFVDNLLVFLDSKKKLYHCYDCSQFNPPIDFGNIFTCCDRRTAKYLGYTPCPFCYNSNSELCVED